MIDKINVMLDEGAKMPNRAHDLDAGYDLFSRSELTVLPHSCVLHDTGVHVEIPKGYVGMLKSKSGLNIKSNLVGEGVIDAGYTGSIVCKLYNHSDLPVTLFKGSKIIQLVILPILTPELNLVSAFKETERGDDGFGSTGP